jgi:hypothetical protein
VDESLQPESERDIFGWVNPAVAFEKQRRRTRQQQTAGVCRNDLDSGQAKTILK